MTTRNGGHRLSYELALLVLYEEASESPRPQMREGPLSLAYIPHFFSHFGNRFLGCFLLDAGYLESNQAG